MSNSRVISAPPGVGWLAPLEPKPVSMLELPPTRAAIASFPIERRNLAARERLVNRVRAEFLEMPGLCLSLPQARRLFGIPHDTCARILASLEREGLLRQRADGCYARVRHT